MKKMSQGFKKAGIFVMLLCVGVSSVGCHGSFGLTKKYYSFVDTTIGNKYIKSIVFYWILGFIYGITGFVDTVILNTIEFWTGSNPLAMNSTDKETQIVQKDGEKYQITATKNRFDIVQVSGKEKGKHVSLVFDEKKSSWISIDSQKNETVLISFDFKNNNVAVLSNNGSYTKKSINDVPAISKESSYALSH